MVHIVSASSWTGSHTHPRHHAPGGRVIDSVESTQVAVNGDDSRLIPERSGPSEMSSHRRPGTINRIDPGRKSLTDHKFGRFHLVERIGSGRQGQVWKAIQLEPFVETVALKVLSPALAHDPKRLAQFHREAEVGAQLESPSLLQTYEFGEVNGIVFLTMPLVNGISLDEVIVQMRSRRARRPEGCWAWWSWLTEEAYIRAMVRVMSRVARALAVAHANQVVHRDVKPANILMDRQLESRVYLSDFGLSRDLDGPPPLTPLYGTGTPLYMAPEKLTACPSDDTLCDVYALGVTLFEAVTRAHPLTIPEGLAPSDWVAHIAVATPSTPRAVNPRVPESLEAVILKAMNRDPARRYPSASALADDLERLSSGELGAQSVRPR